MKGVFARYQDAIYDLSEFQVVGKGVNGQTGNGAFHPWHGFHSDSYFSAVLIKFVDDPADHVIMGTALS